MGPLHSDREVKRALQGKGGWVIGKMFEICPVVPPKMHVTHTPVIQQLHLELLQIMLVQ